ASLRTRDGAIFRWEPFVEKGRTFIDFTWRHADATDPSVSWVTSATLLGLPSRLSVTLRVSNTVVPAPGVPPKLTSRPRLLLELLRHFQVRGAEGELGVGCHALNEQDLPSFVRYELFDHDRTYPVLVLTPSEDGHFIVEPEQLGREFVSLAKLYLVATPAATFALTDELRRRELSVFRGAARVYGAGFTQQADPYKHPLLFPSRLANAETRRSLAEVLAVGTVRLFRLDPAIPLLRDERAVIIDQKRAYALDTMARSSKADLQDWQAMAQEYADENAELRQRVKDLVAQVGDLDNKIAALRYALSQRAPEASAEPAHEVSFTPQSVLEVVETARELYEGQIVFLPTALDSAASSPYQRLEELARVLGLLAGVSDRLRCGPLGRSMKEECTALGIDYRAGISRNTSKKLREQFRFRHDGETYLCEEHIALGGGTYAPEDCLRIYFCSAAGKGITIGHVGRHLDTDRTS
ncbi:MAG TPA: hypothetical protein VMS64_38570, partial [Candidatus Methylomirabilis sp.]|nr:hypothetical protein [Candidatus Methylomirabilis sp.]